MKTKIQDKLVELNTILENLYNIGTDLPTDQERVEPSKDLLTDEEVANDLKVKLDEVEGLPVAVASEEADVSLDEKISMLDERLNELKDQLLTF
jgi:hypothetical protein